MSFTLDAKARNGACAVKIAILYLERSLDGWIMRTITRTGERQSSRV